MKIAILLSGGVDSSVALARLIDQNKNDKDFYIEGFYLKIWLEDELNHLNECPWQEDLKYIEKITEQFNIKFRIIPLQLEYYDRIVTYTIKELKEGRTPSPDIFCNQRIKFGAFLFKLKEIEINENIQFDYIASGHYAIIEKEDDKFKLMQAKDTFKDQTYFLSYLNQKQLSKILFPIGDLTKKEVRGLAKKYDLANQDRKDSQGICFLGKLKFNDFIANYINDKQGDIIDIDTNKKIGIHRGFHFYTIGQRSGLNLSGGPWYVVEKDLKNNIIYISHESKIKEEFEFNIKDLNWISGHPSKQEDFKVKIRHGQYLFKAKIKKLEQDKYRVILNKADSGIASGQYCIIYKNSECLGGGMIEKLSRVK